MADLLVGARIRALRNDSDKRAVAELAAGVEALGFATLWVPGGTADGLEERVRLVLASTESVPVALSVASIWRVPASLAAPMHARIGAEFPGRFVLGIGVSHQPVVEREGLRYERPLDALAGYLDELDRSTPPVGTDARVIGALAPRMTELARERALGVHPYLMPPEHTRWARGVLGDGPMLAPTVECVLDNDPDRARGTARAGVSMHLSFPNYQRNLARLGYSPDAIRRVDDALVDALVAQGGPDVLRERVASHFAAGASTVVIELADDPNSERGSGLEQWSVVAAAVRGLGPAGP
jgi:probable F420-dependent oxidoreductase